MSVLGAGSRFSMVWYSTTASPHPSVGWMRTIRSGLSAAQQQTGGDIVSWNVPRSGGGTQPETSISSLLSAIAHSGVTVGVEVEVGEGLMVRVRVRVAVRGLVHPSSDARTAATISSTLTLPLASASIEVHRVTSPETRAVPTDAISSSIVTRPSRLQSPTQAPKADGTPDSDNAITTAVFAPSMSKPIGRLLPL